MSAFAGDQERRLVPRWRFTRELPRSAEFAGDPGKLNCFDPDPRFLDEKVIEWKERRVIATAADAVACGVTTGRAEIVGEAAQFLLDHDDRVTPHVRQLAEYALRSRNQGRQQEAGLELPFLPTTNAYASAEVRVARARLNRDPRNLLAYVDLSRAYTILGQRLQALSAMQNALRVSPDHRYALRAAARLFVHIGEPDRAFRLLVDSVRTPNDPWLIAPAIAIATIANRSPRFVRRARELIERRCYGAKDLTEVYGALGTLEYYAGRSAKARKSFRASLIAPTENVVAQARWAGERLHGIDIAEEAWNVPRSYEASCGRALDDGVWSKASQYCTQWVQDEPFSSRPAVLGSYIGISLVAEPRFSEECARVGLRVPEILSGIFRKFCPVFERRFEVMDSKIPEIQVLQSGAGFTDPGWGRCGPLTEPGSAVCRLIQQSRRS